MNTNIKMNTDTQNNKVVNTTPAAKSQSKTRNLTEQEIFALDHEEEIVEAETAFFVREIAKVLLDVYKNSIQSYCEDDPAKNAKVEKAFCRASQLIHDAADAFEMDVPDRVLSSRQNDNFCALVRISRNNLDTILKIGIDNYTCVEMTDHGIGLKSSVSEIVENIVGRALDFQSRVYTTTDLLAWDYTFALEMDSRFKNWRLKK